MPNRPLRWGRRGGFEGGVRGLVPNKPFTRIGDADVSVMDQLNEDTSWDPQSPPNIVSKDCQFGGNLVSWSSGVTKDHLADLHCACSHNGDAIGMITILFRIFF